MTILLATDFTEAADNALDYAIQAFDPQNGEKNTIILVHGYKPLAPYTNVPSMPVIHNDELEQALHQKMEERVKKLSSLERFEVDSVFQKDTLPQIVEQVAKDKNPDIIVMGSREHTAYERMTIGSNTMEVATQEGTCPVLAVPREASFEKISEVVITTDMEPLNISYESLAFLKLLVEQNEAQLTVLHVSDTEETPDLEDTAMHRYLEDIQHEHQVVQNSDVFDGIISYVEKEKPDLLAAIPRDRNFFQSIFHSSTTEDMVYRSRLPTLILR